MFIPSGGMMQPMILIIYTIWVHPKRGNHRDDPGQVKFYDKTCANAPVEDIVEEFKLLTKLDHPKIARVYEVFQDAWPDLKRTVPFLSEENWCSAGSFVFDHFWMF
jgi:hypothetical protein